MEDDVQGVSVVLVLILMKLPEITANRIPKADNLFSCNQTVIFFEEIKQLIGGVTSCAGLEKHQLVLEESVMQEKAKLELLGTMVQGNMEKTAHLLSDNAKALEALRHLETIVGLLVARANETSRPRCDCMDRSQSPVHIVLSIPSHHRSGGSGSSDDCGVGSGDGSGTGSGGGSDGGWRESKEELAKLRAEMDSHKEDVTNIVSTLNKKLENLESQTVLMKDAMSEMMSAMHGVNEYVRTQYKVQKDCPEPYGKVGSKCLYLETYRKKSFSEARKHCQEKAAQFSGDGDLAVVLDVYEFISYVARSEKAKAASWLWVGAYRQDRTSPWQWVTEDVVSEEHFVWNEEEPTNSKDDENAVCFQMTSLLFHNCENGLTLNYVCEFIKI